MSENKQSNRKSERGEMIILSSVSWLVAQNITCDVVIFDADYFPYWIFRCSIFVHAVLCSWRSRTWCICL